MFGFVSFGCHSNSPEFKSSDEFRFAALSKQSLTSEIFILYKMSLCFHYYNYNYTQTGRSMLCFEQKDFFGSLHFTTARELDTQRYSFW